MSLTHDLLERGWSVAERCRLFVRADRRARARARGRCPPARSRSGRSGFVVSGSSSSGHVTDEVGDPSAGVDVREQRLERDRLGSSFASPDFACVRTRSSRPRRDLGRRRAARASSVSRSGGRIRLRRNAVDDASSASTVRRLPSRAAPVPGTSCTRIDDGRQLRGALDRGDRVEPIDRRSAPCRRATSRRGLERRRG